MSSLVRRMAIRLMKRSGYTRNKWIVTKDAKGNKYPQPVARDGEITDRDDNPIGRDWPARIPADAIPTKRPPEPRPSIPHLSRRAPSHPPLGSRRGKRSKGYIERRKAVA
jgi:hypothetical protein